MGKGCSVKAISMTILNSVSRRYDLCLVEDVRSNDSNVIYIAKSWDGVKFPEKSVTYHRYQVPRPID